MKKFVIASVIIIAIILFVKRKPMFKRSDTQKFIDGLHPLFRPVITKWVEWVENPSNGDLTVQIIRGTSTPEQQEHIRTHGGNTNVSTSLHNFGFAFDCNIYGTDKDGKKIHLVMASPEKDWLPYAGKAIGMGMTWGGNFKNTPKPDRVHFSWLGEHNAKNYLALQKQGKIDSNGFVIV